MTRTMSIILTGRLSRPLFILAMGAVLLHADASPAKFSATESNVVAASVTTPTGNTPEARASVTVRKKRDSETDAASCRKKAAAPADDGFDEYASTASIADPIQPVNRKVFWFNHQLYRYILKPVSRAYDTVLPQPVRTGIYNVFDNLEYPDRLVNNLLQARFDRAGQETGKFVVNTVAGVGGIFKVSDRIPALSGVPRTDTGLTFAQWGIQPGVYIVWPVIGPKSLRDTVGFAGDYALSPLTWSFYVFPGAAWTVAFTAPDSTRTLNGRMSAYDAATEHSIDPYLALRSSYIQNRQQAAKRKEAGKGRKETPSAER
jgi:phospholipid-binding lipoprotein MlaA